MGRADQHPEPEPPASTAGGETLRAGPSRPSLWQRVPASWRQPVVVVLALLLGLVLGALAAQVGQEEPAPAADEPVLSHEHDVELLLIGAALPRRRESGPTPRRLLVRAAVLLSGNQQSEVLAIDSLDGSLVVRARQLPVTVSPGERLQPVTLEVVPRDCATARRWPPDSRPFAVTWRDPDGLEHTDRGGDHDRSVARAVRRHLVALCR